MEVTVNPAYLHLGQKITWKIVNVLKISCLFPPMENELVVPPPTPRLSFFVCFPFLFYYLHCCNFGTLCTQPPQFLISDTYN